MQKLNVNTVGVALLGDPQIKNNTNPVGATIGRPRFEGITLKNQKGITLIALIITIIVMLILVGVTINVALNGGLFDKADEAAKQTQIKADKEELYLEAIAAYNEKDRTIDTDKLKTNLEAKGWTVNLDKNPIVCTSPNENSFNLELDANGNIKIENAATSGGNQTDDNLEYLKAELEGKASLDVATGLDENGNIIFVNSEISCVRFLGNGHGGIALLLFRNEFFTVDVSDKFFNVERNPFNNSANFIAKAEGNNAIIMGLTDNGEANLVSSKKIIIPATITGTDGVIYAVTEIRERAFENNTNIEQLEFETGINLDKIGQRAFSDCTNLSGDVIIPDKLVTIAREAFSGCTAINNIYIPSSVDNMGYEAFGGWTDEQTIRMGKTEEPALVGSAGDTYSEVGWVYSWKIRCNAKIEWGK